MASPSGVFNQEKSVSSIPLSERKSLSFSEKLEEHLASTDSDCDVIFSVGPEREKVRAVRLVLVVSSPVFKYLFENTWDHDYHTISDDGIPLPDVDSEAFRIFLKLLLWDNVSSEKLGALQLSAKNLFNLVEISKKYGMTEMQASVEYLIDQFFKTINKFVKTEEFLTLPRNILGWIVNRESLPMDEVAVFQCAYKWAEYQCIAHGFEQSGANIRGMLDEHLYSIRFPVMNIKDFGNRVCPASILTAEEELKIFKYISMAENDRQSFDTSNLPFSINRRKRCDPVVVNNSTGSGSPGSQGQLGSTMSAGSVEASNTRKRTTRADTSASADQESQGVGQRRSRRATLGASARGSDHSYSSSPSLNSSGVSLQNESSHGPVKAMKSTSSLKRSAPTSRTSNPKRATVVPAKATKPGPGPKPKSSKANLSDKKPSCPSQQRLVGGIPSRFPRKKSDEIPLTDSLADGALVNVTYKWHCGRISICADEDGAKYDVLEELMTKHAKNAPPMERIPEMNEIVIAPDNRQRYYRGVVTGFRGDLDVKVEFIDYGGETVVGFSELRELNEEINAYPLFAIKFVLKDVPERAYHLNVSKNTELQDAMKSGGRIEVLKKTPGVWTGKLWISDSRSWSDIVVDALNKSPSGR